MPFLSFLVILCCISLGGISLFQKKKFVAPSVLIPILWGGLTLFYGVIDHGMYPLSSKVYVAILFWVTTFYCGAIIFEKVAIKGCDIHDFHQTTLNFYYKIALISTPFIIYSIYTMGMEGGFSFFANIRLAVVGMSDTSRSLGILRYISTLALITFLIELYQYNGSKNKKRIIVLFVINIIATFSTMAKTSLIYFFVCSLVVLVFKWGKIGWRKLLFALLSLIVVFSLFQILRNLNTMSEGKELIFNMLNVYILGGMPAFDALIKENVSSTLFGANSLSFFYKFIETFAGISLADGQGQFIGDGSGYAMVPFPTNVFTVFAPFYSDFGLIGILVFGFITGALAGIIYRLAKKRVGWAVIFYSYIACALLLEFFSDFIFLMLSQTIQFFLISYFAYRYRWKVRIFPKYGIEHCK